ncbi:MAG: hypothetical protein FJZ01_01140 [Candidatus Sericytochromatia bacterium]|nr:hypothetical protein [Candidatus Tanganyikabacteria bacterium]
MLALTRRRTNRDKAAFVTDEGLPTQLGLGDVALGNGLDAIRADLRRMIEALSGWLTHALRERGHGG